MKKENKKIKIFLTKGSAEGITQESAYCQALNKTGLINLNLIPLSSVLPHNSYVIEERPIFSNDDYGKKLYAIISGIRTDKNNTTICAGLGWMLEEGGDGNGLVIQIEGKNKQEVFDKIDKSLDEVAKISEKKYKKIKIVTEEISSRNKPVCALVALVFKLEDWF